MDKLAPSLIPLDAVDPAMVEELLDRAFGPGRKARTAYKVRGDAPYLPALSFGLVDEEQMLVATIQAWPVALTDVQGRAHPLIMVGPVAVLPEKQGEGFGTALMLAQAQALGEIGRQVEPLPQVLIGDAPYYGRFGFSADYTGGWTLPGPWEKDRLLLRCANPAILPREGTLGPWKG
ncbi:N-acetyltransferase [Altererythrobacter lauratis]|uniref:GNAT family N-acetyltransferase n=1 Tax=Alteraurantiacibacter lauratis TaxID=2054627 RepID=A0ABV7EGQ2_9SPHN